MTAIYKRQANLIILVYYLIAEKYFHYDKKGRCTIGKLQIDGLLL